MSQFRHLFLSPFKQHENHWDAWSVLKLAIQQLERTLNKTFHLKRLFWHIHLIRSEALWWRLIQNNFIQKQNFSSHLRDFILEFLFPIMNPATKYFFSPSTLHTSFPNGFSTCLLFCSLLKHSFSSHFIVCNQRSEIIADVPLLSLWLIGLFSCWQHTLRKLDFTCFSRHLLFKTLRGPDHMFSSHLYSLVNLTL